MCFICKMQFLWEPSTFLGHFGNSHELRTPMACIIGLLDMLLSEKLSQDTESSVRQIHRCATSLVALLNSALDIAKVCSLCFDLFVFKFVLACHLSNHFFLHESKLV